MRASKAGEAKRIRWWSQPHHHPHLCKNRVLLEKKKLQAVIWNETCGNNVLLSLYRMQICDWQFNWKKERKIVLAYGGELHESVKFATMNRERNSLSSYRFFFFFLNIHTSNFVVFVKFERMCFSILTLILHRTTRRSVARHLARLTRELLIDYIRRTFRRRLSRSFCHIWIMALIVLSEV